MSFLYAFGLTILPNIGGLLGSLLIMKEIPNWYDIRVNKSPWQPPNWIFPFVWTGIYSSMGFASYLIYRDSIGNQANLALGLYATQLALNWGWMPIFYSFHQLGLATAELALLDANILACIWSFYSINRTASYIMIPYLVWSLYLTGLTLDTWNRNKSRNVK